MGKIYKFKPPEIEEEKFDPLNVLPQEILDIIFGYLRVRDLRNLSLSSVNWYNTIAKSECIKRIKLVIYTASLDSHMIDALLNSTREYQFIRIHLPDNTSVGTSSKKDINAILKKFAGSIKSLQTPFDIPRVYDMPKLRQFALISAIRGRMIKYYETGLFSNIESLEQLYIRQRKWTDKFLKHLKDTLPTMKNLTILRVSKNILKDADYSFKLRNFLCYEYIGDNDWMNMVKFLKTQSASLEVLLIKLSRSDNDIEEVLSIILAMPNLSRLSLRIPYNVNVSACLPINTTIKFFICGQNLTILAYLKNLQVLKVDEITLSLVNAISSCPLLRQVEYGLVHYELPADFMRTVRQQHPNIQFIKYNLYHQYDY